MDNRKPRLEQHKLTRPYCFVISNSLRENPISEYNRRLAEELARLGHRVILVVDHQRFDQVNPSGNPAVLTWPSARPVHLRDARFLLSILWESRPDCVVAHFGAVNWMMFLGWLMGVPVRIAWYHTLSEQINLDAKIQPWKLKALRIRKGWVYRFATHLVANSSQARLDAARVFHVPEGKIHVSHYSMIDPHTHLDIAQAVLHKHNRIVCVGRLDRSKGQDTLLKAAALLMRDFSFDLEIIGSGETKDSLISLAQDLGISQRCLFTGSVTHDQVLLKMAQALITVVPSRSEAFGLVNIESMAVGTPLVSSRVGGIPEIVRDSVDGYLFTPGDYLDLAGALRKLLLDANLRKQMGEHARQRFIECYELRTNMAVQVNWLTQLIRQ